MNFDAQKILSDWADAEKEFAIHDYRGAVDGPMTKTYEGSRPILLTAVHATRHYMAPGRFKAHDKWTGGLVTILAQELDASAVIRQRLGYFEDDEKVWQVIEQKIQRQRPRFILDIHACVSACPWDIVFGTSTTYALTETQRSHLITIREIAKDRGLSHMLQWIGPIAPYQHEMLEVLKDEAKTAGLTTNTNTISYSALSGHSVTTRAMAMGVPTIQLELRPEIRNPTEDQKKASSTFNMLRRAVLKLCV